MNEITKYYPMNESLLIYAKDGESSNPNATTMQMMQEYMIQNGEAVKNLIDNNLWQPNTEYSSNIVITSPNMPSGFCAVATFEGETGTTSDTEPSWQATEDKRVSDGSVTWVMKKKLTDLTGLINDVSELDGVITVSKVGDTTNTISVLTPTMKNIANGVAGLNNKTKLPSQLYDFATQAEAEAGVIDTKPMTPLKTKRAISKLALLAKDYIIERGGTNAKWYEIYKSGKIRQGGFINATANPQQVNFLKPFKTDQYTVTLGGKFTQDPADGWAVCSTAGKVPTTTYMYLYLPAGNLNADFYWVAEEQN